MDTAELEKARKEFFISLLNSTHKQSITDDQIKEPNPSALDKIWDQRYSQREKLFEFAMKLTWSGFTVLVCVFFFQMWSQVSFHRDLLTGYSLQVLTVGVFGQIIFIIRIIANSIWDDKPYSKLLDKDHARKHKNE